MNRRPVLWFALIVLGLLALALLARAVGTPAPAVKHDHVVIQPRYTLSASVDDSLFVVAQDITVDAAARVTGDAAFIGGTLHLNGRVDGGLTATGSTLVLGPEAYIGGDVVLLGSRVEVDGQVDGTLTMSGQSLRLAPDARVTGALSACAEEIDDERAGARAPLPCADGSDLLGAELRQALSLAAPPVPVALVALLASLFVSLALCGAAALAATVFPVQVERMESALRAAPRRQAVTGLLAVLGAVGIGSGFVVVLALAPVAGLLLLPLLLILGLALLGAALAGLVALTHAVGEWLVRRAGGADVPPLVAAALGSAALGLLLLIPALLPSGALVSLTILVALAALASGAALTTRLGTR